MAEDQYSTERSDGEAPREAAPRGKSQPPPVATPRVDEDLFPSLQRLSAARKRGRVPFVQQTEAADCGPACLAMVLRYLGREVMLDEVREAIGGGRDGADAA